MIKIDYPPPTFQVKSQGGKDFIFDSLRRKWLLLTPEEWVRQNFVQYLVQIRQYPSTLIALEKEIKLGELTKRFDIMVYNKQHQPWMIVECKEMNVPLTENVLHQALRYNISVPVSFLVITNGSRTIGWERSQAGITEINEIPGWQNGS